MNQFNRVKLVFLFFCLVLSFNTIGQVINGMKPAEIQEFEPFQMPIPNIQSPYTYRNYEETYRNGTLSVFSASKKDGPLKIYIDNIYVGSINDYFLTYQPSCREIGTLTIDLKPGFYEFKAVDNSYTWKDNVRIIGSKCYRLGVE